MKKTLGIVFFVLLSWFARPQEVRVNTPDSLDYWDIGKTYTIQWQTPGISAETVKIRLYDKTRAHILLKITNNTPNDGFFDWEVPGNLSEGEYVIRVEDAYDPGIFAESGYFSLRHTAPGRITLSNDGSPHCLRGETQRFTWTCHGFDGRVRVNLFRNGAFVKTILGSSRECSVNWRVDEPAGDGYQIALNAVSQPSITVRGDAFAIFDGADLLVFSRGILPQQTFLRGESAVLRAEVENPVNQAVPVDISIRFVRGRVSRSPGITARKLYMLAKTRYTGSPTATLNAGGRTSFAFPVTFVDDPPGDYTVIITILPTQTSGFRDKHPGNNTIQGYYKVGLKLLKTIR